MSDIFYSYGNNAYANLTNKCSCQCSFCIRHLNKPLITESNLWLDKDPTPEEAKSALDVFDPGKYDELVFCGYGEPTYALDTMLQLADYAKKRYGLKLRLNTNGLGNLINDKDIVSEIASHIDSISISLNAADSETYKTLCKPIFDGAYAEILSFTKKCHEYMNDVTLSVVSVIAPEEIKKCHSIADDIGVNFRIRDFI